MRIIRFSQRDNQKGSSIELSFKTLGDLVDQNDPSPYSLKEVTQVAEDAIADHVGDLPLKREVELSINLPEKDLNPEVQGELPDAIRQHFTIRASEIALERKRKKLRVTLGVKLIATTIAITILIGGATQLIPQSKKILTSIVQFFIIGALTILNWVVIWDTYEAYGIEYLGLVKKMRIYEKIARIQIRITARHSNLPKR
jgi:hypothetical protein